MTKERKGQKDKRDDTASPLTKMPIRNRIKEHRRVRAGDLAPHEHNWRNHPDSQREALQALYAEVGFARSLLAYELPDGRLKLIDGHLRRELDPDMLVDVEVLNVDDEEARKLLLSMDSLANKAEPDQEVVAQLREITRSDSPVLTELWRSVTESEAATRATLEDAVKATPEQSFPEQFFIVVKCRDEKDQVELLQKLEAQGLSCRALVS
jgi:hypothetical protein